MFQRVFQMTVVAVGVSLCLLIVGCASTGNTKLAALETTDISKLFIKGKTTTSEVLACLGEPSDIDFDKDGNKKWTYIHTKSTSKVINFVPIANSFVRGTDDTTKKIVIVFDKKTDTLIDFLVTKTQGETKAGILGG